MSKSRIVLMLLATGAFSLLQAEELDAIDYEAAEEYIIECSRDWAESVVTGDRTKRRVYFADDFVGTDTAGNRYDKAAITRETGPAQYIVSNTLNDVEVRFFGETAVVHGDETWVRKDGTTGRYVWTDIWVRRDGEWQIVAAQDAAASAND